MECIQPHKKEKYYQADVVMFRLADVYYMKAECLLRTGGNQAEAVQLINAVKQRNFAPEDREKALYKTITLDELLKDRGREFMGECFRRTVYFGSDVITRPTGRRNLRIQVTTYCLFRM